MNVLTPQDIAHSGWEIGYARNRMSHKKYSAQSSSSPKLFSNHCSCEPISHFSTSTKQGIVSRLKFGTDLLHAHQITYIPNIRNSSAGSSGVGNRTTNTTYCSDQHKNTTTVKSHGAESRARVAQLA